jgi:hypothetical protein
VLDVALGLLSTCAMNCLLECEKPRATARGSIASVPARDY